MKRYHNKIYFPDIDKLKEFNNTMNTLDWKYSHHCLENLKYRVMDVRALLLHIRALELNCEDIFEYYIQDNGVIDKACYRIKHNEFDFILVISRCKNIVTIYINSKNDTHVTLDKNLYCNTLTNA